MLVKIKKCTFLLCFVVSCFLMGGDAFAAGNESNVPVKTSEIPVLRWSNTNSIDINLAFEGSKAYCGACVQGWRDVTEITGTAVLSRKNSNGTYTTVKTWSDLKTSSNRLIFDGIYYVSRGYTYRLTITATVYRNGIGETVSGHFDSYAK